MNEYSIGIDIGGTKISTAIIDKKGQVYHQRKFPTPNTTNKEILNLLAETVSHYERMAEEEGLHIVGVGIGTAGQVDYQNGKILSGTVNITDWNNVDIRRILSQTTNLPIYVDNDANTFTIAECFLGGAKGKKDVVCLTLGTGIGGGIVSGGDVIRGAWGGAAELGHFTVNFNGPPCNCGSRGCLEAYASGSGIANRMRDQLHTISEYKHTNKEVAYYQQHPNELTSREVFEWYDAGLPEAIYVVEQTITALSYGTVNMIHTFNPSMIIFGGGIVEVRNDLIEEVSKRINTIGISSLIKPVEIIGSQLGYNAGLIGAAYQVWLEDNRF